MKVIERKVGNIDELYRLSMFSFVCKTDAMFILCPQQTNILFDGSTKNISMKYHFTKQRSKSTFNYLINNFLFFQ